MVKRSVLVIGWRGGCVFSPRMDTNEHECSAARWMCLMVVYNHVLHEFWDAHWIRLIDTNADECYDSCVFVLISGSAQRTSKGLA